MKKEALKLSGRNAQKNLLIQDIENSQERKMLQGSNDMVATVGQRRSSRLQSAMPTRKISKDQMHQVIKQTQVPIKISVSSLTAPTAQKKKPLRKGRGRISKNNVHSQHTASLTIQIPKSADQFLESYKDSMNFIFSYSPQTIQEERTFVEKYKLALFELFTTVMQRQGIVDVVSQGYKQELLQQFAQEFNVQDAQSVFSIYKKYLFHYENLIRNQKFKIIRDPTSLFNQATFVEEQIFSQFLQKDPLNTSYYDHDILVFRNGQKSLNIDQKYIELDKVAESYKTESVDIRIQKPMDFGFNVKKLRNQPFKMTVENYRKYQKLCQQNDTTDLAEKDQIFDELGKLKNLNVNGQLLGQRVKNGEIFFAVNFQPKDGQLLSAIQAAVHSTFLGYKQKFDLMSYLDHEIPGCSLPQFYLKVRGVWTGGHQENVNMCAVNINHGPDSSEWYTMDLQHVQKFRAALKERFKIDLYTQQGLWYQKINWFVQNGFPIKKIIQKKGDVVISGPGTLHWVRSHGIALQSAWNIFPVTEKGMRASYHRERQNALINFNKSNVIPLKILTLKLLNHQGSTLQPGIVQLCSSKVRQWLNAEEELYRQIKKDFPQSFANAFKQPPKKQALEDLQGFCLMCTQQIFEYFFLAEDMKDIYCMRCFKKYKNIRRFKMNFHKRHQIFSIQLLLKLCQKRQVFDQLPQFCNGPYIGQIGAEKCRWKNHKSYPDKTLVEQVNEMNQKLSELNQKKSSSLYNIAPKMKDDKREQLQNEIEEEQEKKPNSEIDKQPAAEQSSHKQRQKPQERSDRMWRDLIWKGVTYKEQDIRVFLVHAAEQQYRLYKAKIHRHYEYYVKSSQIQYLKRRDRDNNNYNKNCKDYKQDRDRNNQYNNSNRRSDKNYFNHHNNRDNRYNDDNDKKYKEDRRKDNQNYKNSEERRYNNNDAGKYYKGNNRDDSRRDQQPSSENDGRSYHHNNRQHHGNGYKNKGYDKRKKHNNSNNNNNNNKNNQEYHFQQSKSRDNNHKSDRDDKKKRKRAYDECDQVNNMQRIQEQEVPSIKDPKAAIEITKTKIRQKIEKIGQIKQVKEQNQVNSQIIGGNNAFSNKQNIESIEIQKTVSLKRQHADVDRFRTSQQREQEQEGDKGRKQIKQNEKLFSSQNNRQEINEY